MTEAADRAGDRRHRRGLLRRAAFAEEPEVLVGIDPGDERPRGGGRVRAVRRRIVTAAVEQVMRRRPLAVGLAEMGREPGVQAAVPG
ncbi:MAG: hypothetical protein ACKOES_04415, partial [Planctomycetaceae bacterium]